MAPASGPTNYAEIQDNEIQVLQSIFMDDFQENEAKKAAWNKQADRSFVIKVSAPSNNSEDDWLRLHVAFPATYPKTRPTCHLEFGQGLTEKARKQLQSMLESKLAELVGQEAIFEIASSLSENLENEVAARATSADQPALNEEREVQEKRSREAAIEAESRKQRQQQESEIEERQTLALMVARERHRLERIQATTISSNDVPGVQADRKIDEIDFDREMRAQTEQGSTVKFRAVFDVKDFRQGPVTSINTVRSVGSSARDAPFLALKTIIIAAKKGSAAIKSRLEALEDTFEILADLPYHPYIAPVIGTRVIGLHTQDKATDPTWHIHILTTLEKRGSIADLLDTIGVLSAEVSRAWTIQILEGLDFLHRHRLVHGRLSLTNVLLCRSSNGDIVPRLSDVAFQSQIHALQEKSVTAVTTAQSTYWLAPETAAQDAGAPMSPAQDIWYLGRLILQMVLGSDIENRFSSPSEALSFSNLSTSLEDLCSRALRAEPRKRPTAFEMLPHDFLRNDDPIHGLHSPSLPSTISLGTPVKHARARLNSSHTAPSASRYLDDFNEIGRLGKGGFGEVVRARNKLDSTVYAIKKIVQPSKSALSGLLSEVMLLSRLNNPFIVRYYTAWLEEESGVAIGGPMRESSTEETNPFESSSHEPYSQTDPLDFISSGVEFGYDSDESGSKSGSVNATENAECSDTNEDRLMRTRRRHSSTTAKPASKTTLYIQMEYCEKRTLRDLITGNLAETVDEIWRLFGQILEGLSHIHSHGVIHRDIKPDNIFITTDNTNTVRIGDFGLATPGQIAANTHSNEVAHTHLTASIGTSVYVAPEVRSSHGGQYGQKADMYSLGIVLLEMFVPLKTAMERVHVLDDARRPQIILPALFEDADKTLARDIITSLLQHQPKHRPSSSELLQRGVIPSQAHDQTIRTALAAFSDKDTPVFRKLLNSLFSAEAGHRREQDITFDLNLNLRLDAAILSLEGSIKAKMIDIFQCHGAVETHRPGLLPFSNRARNTSGVRLMNAAGRLVQLPFDMTQPFVRMLTKRTELTPLKSFFFGNVFRNSTPEMHPRIHAEVDFDIVSSNSLDLALHEAEAIKVMDEIFDAIPSIATTPIVYYMSHGKILDSILSAIPGGKRDVVKQVFSRLHIGQWSWTKIRTELRSAAIGVSSTALDDLARFDFCLPCDEAISRLQQLLPAQDALEPAYGHVKAVCSYTARFGVRRLIFVKPLAAVNEHLYSGQILFQAVLDSNRKKVLCAGGRYDRLIQDHSMDTRGSQLHAVGFSLAWESLIDLFNQHLQSSKKGHGKRSEGAVARMTREGHVDVLIDSNSPSLLRSTGIDLVQLLWQHRISAELVIDSTVPEGKSHQQYHKTEDCPWTWLVLVKDEVLKVRSMISKEDTELHAADLLPYIRSEKRERDRLEGRPERSRAPPALVHGDSTSAHDAEVIVLASQGKNKKPSRRAIIEEAQSKVHQLSQTLASTPIAAVELRDDVFNGIRASRILDAESWRRLVQSAPASDRTYMSQLQELLQEHSRDSTAAVWIYNTRTRACFLYDLG